MYVLLFNNVAWLFMCVLLVAMGESLFSIVGGLYAGYEGYYGVYFLFVGLLVGYMLLFTFSFSFLLFVTDLFSVRVFILALGV